MEKDITIPYLRFKSRDFDGCLKLLKDSFGDSENISIRSNVAVADFLSNKVHDYDKLYEELSKLLNSMTSTTAEKTPSTLLLEAIVLYNISVVLIHQEQYEEARKKLRSICEQFKSVDLSVILRAYLLHVEVVFCLYKLQGETKEWLHEHCFPLFSQIESILTKELFPDFIKHRLQFRYHIYRSLYFLEQGSVKGVKKEVKASSDFYLLFSNETDEDYLEYVQQSVQMKGSLSTIALDNYETITTFDGYLPPLLKTRLEYRRGNCLKILSLLNQVYEDEDDHSITSSLHPLTPTKDYFYYSMMSSIYYVSNLFSLSLHYMQLALVNAQQTITDHITIGTILKNIGLLFACQKKYDDSVRFLQASFSYIPENIHLLFRIAEIRFQQFKTYIIEKKNPNNEAMKLGGSNEMRSNPFAILRDGFATYSVTSEWEESDSKEQMRLLKESDQLFEQVIGLLDTRNEQDSEYYIFSYLRRATISLEMNRYEECIRFCEVCQCQFDKVKLSNGTDEADISVFSLQSVTALFKAEALMNLGQFSDALNELSPILHPQFFDPLIVTVWKDFSQLVSKQEAIENIIQEKKYPYMESFIYNSTMLCVYKRDLVMAKHIVKLLMLFNQSLKNARLYMYVMLQSGDREAAKQFSDEYMIKC